MTRNDCLYDCIPHTLTYSTNCGTTLVAHKPVYLVGTIGNDGLFYLGTPWWTQTEPTTEDGKVYIYLGDAYSTSAIYKVANNPAYEYRDGAFRGYSYVPKVPALVSACATGDYHAASTVIALTVSLADYNKLLSVCGTDSATEGVQTIEVPLNTGRTYHRLVWFTGDVSTNYQWDGIARNAKAITVTINTSTNKVTIVSSNVTANGIRQIYAE